jgi:hypothetical protein
MQLIYHNQSKKHKTTLRQKGLTETHDMMTYVNKYDSPISYQGNFLLDCSQNNGLLKRKKLNTLKKSSNYLKMCKDISPSYFSIEVLHIQDAMKIIKKQRELGFDIPLCIKVILKVKKMLDYKHVRKGFD